jgi:hypothetical protein
MECFDDDDDPLSCVENPEDVFQVVPALGAAIVRGQVVNTNDLIRLRHVASGKYLHSHAIKSPQSNNDKQFEVTLYENQDSNDNFKVEVDQPNVFGNGWQTSSLVRLIHMGTGRALHSHEIILNDRPRSQEVTTYQFRDDNDFWIIPRFSMSRCDLAVTPNGTDGMEVPRPLARGAEVVSMNARFKLVHQTDGNVVLYNCRAQYDMSPTGFKAKPIWATNTNGQNTTNFTLTPEGNLVLLGGAGEILWQSNTSGSGARMLFLHNDGNLITKNKFENWESQTYAVDPPAAADPIINIPTMDGLGGMGGMGGGCSIL